MKNLLQRARKTIKIKNMLFLTIAGIINAFGITIFLNPVNLYDSGISGTAMLAAQLTPESLSLSLFLIIFNLPLFLFGLKKQGKKFTFYAIYTVAVYSFVSWLITDVLPVDVSMASPLCRVWRCDFGYRQRSCNQIWRCNGRHRGYGSNLCEENRYIGWFIRYGIQYRTLCCMRVHSAKLDSSALFDCYIFCRT